MTIFIIFIFLMISIPFALNDIYPSFLVILHILFAMQGICSPAASNIPIKKLTAAFLFIITTLIISKNPGNTGIPRDIRTEFTTDLLLSG